MLPIGSSFQCYGRAADSSPDSEPSVFFNHSQYPLELLTITSGELIVKLDGKDLRVGVGETVIINPHVLHSGRLPAGCYGVSYYCISLDLEHFAATLPEPERSIAAEICLNKRFFEVSVSEGGEVLAEIADEFCREYKIDKKGRSNCRLCALVYQLLDELFTKHLIEKRQTSDIDRDFVCAVERYVSENYSRDFGTAEIAAALSYSEGYFCRLFKASFGIKFSRYLREYRLLRSSALRGSGKSLTEIALEVGFTDYAYFSRLFTRFFGLPPGKFFAGEKRNDSIFEFVLPSTSLI